MHNLNSCAVVEKQDCTKVQEFINRSNRAKKQPRDENGRFSSYKSTDLIFLATKPGPEMKVVNVRKNNIAPQKEIRKRKRGGSLDHEINWIKSIVVPSPGSILPLSRLYEEYDLYCESVETEIKGKRILGKAFALTFPNCRRGRERREGHREAIYYDFKIRAL
jgi:hypothetical protein